MRTILITLAVLAAGSAAAADRSPRVSRGTPYLTESIRLTNGGWKPVTLSDAPGCGFDDSRCYRRPEVKACSSDPLGQCTSTWLRSNRIIEVVTVGRDPARVVRTRCGAAC